MVRRYISSPSSLLLYKTYTRFSLTVSFLSAQHTLIYQIPQSTKKKKLPISEASFLEAGLPFLCPTKNDKAMQVKLKCSSV